MSCAVDTAWHKRGFDSLTSHTFFMSKAKYGKKVVKALVGHRTCGTCKWWMRNRPGLPIRKHRCVLNHFGSARLMECKSGVQGIKELSEGGTPVDYLEGDGDNTMIAHIKSDLNITMKKRFDRNHVVKNIGKSLYALQGKKLSRSVIMHIQKCLKYAFAKNQRNKEGLEKNLKALIPHQFGDHSLCFPRFCGFRRTSSNEKYTHKSLPYKAALKDDELQSKLKKLFKPVIANAEQYADLGSSQQCEHANREVTLRAPKSLHYGNSESLDFRVAATTAFINEGRSYVSEVNMAAGISPGTFSVKYAAKQMKRRKRVQLKSQLPSTKRRRVTLKQECVITQGANEVLEGTTYESGIGHTTNVDVEQLPEAVPRGKFATVSAGKEATVITFDLETTDLIRGGKMPHITQIAASDMETGKGFSTYVLPKVPISTTAQQVTGIIVNNSGTMTVNGKQVQPETVQFAVDKFCKWLSGFPNVFLVATYGRRFDFPVFSSALINIQCEAQFFNCVSGLIDSLPVFKKAFPGQSSYKQEELAKTFLHSSYEAHNAIEDVKVLGKLVSHTKMKIQELARFSFPPSAVHNLLLFNKEKAKHIKTLHSLLAQGVMKMSIAEKIAGSGLNLGHLRKIFQRDGEDGLRNTFTYKNSEGQPRVTDVKKTLDNVIPKLVLFLNKD
ncbi:uncharacterized protein LOC124114456 isoform X1 [Haliotis rufescens]|uniref:uncharacterized protein LOC124114456 isoform X1 n=1 Tax=Haliotis rufescens TaxID=6454 RepID=UPI00201FA5D0|nr:uncharacterized protein LOC124114456 isoform X1 [Haliotis rufescens]